MLKAILDCLVQNGYVDYMFTNIESTEFTGKRVLVTGGSRGIGATIVRQLLDAGAQVVTTSRNAVADIPEGVHYVQADLSTPEGAKTLAGETLKVLGGLDILVNNAGVTTPRMTGIADITDEDWQNDLNGNFLNVVRLTAELRHALEASLAGVIVNVSSAATLSAPPIMAHYAAAKSALETYSRSLAAELALKGVRVNVVIPGNIETPGADRIRAQIAEHFGVNPNAGAIAPLGRKGLPSDIAQAVIFLASDRAEWITGSVLLVDGGAAVTG